MDSFGQLDSLLAAPSARDDVRERAGDVVALAPELVGQVGGLLPGFGLDPDLPGRVAPLQQLLLDVGPVGLVVPALVVVQPALGDEPGRGQALVGPARSR